jgi:hypothetical protein
MQRNHVISRDAARRAKAEPLRLRVPKLAAQ